MTSPSPNSLSFNLLKSEYNKLLLDYDKSQKDIIDSITNNKHNLVSAGNYTQLTGGTNLDTINNVANVDDCIAECSKNTKCKGANFTEDITTNTNLCTLFSGISTINFDSTESNTAIITDTI